MASAKQTDGQATSEVTVEPATEDARVSEVNTSDVNHASQVDATTDSEADDAANEEARGQNGDDENGGHDAGDENDDADGKDDEASAVAPELLREDLVQDRALAHLPTVDVKDGRQEVVPERVLLTALARFAGPALAERLGRHVAVLPSS